MALVTAAQVRDWVPQITGTDEDTRLGTLIQSAESALCQWLGFPATDSGTFRLETSTYTDYLDGPSHENARELRLRMRPLVTVTSVYQSADESYGASDLVASSDYFVDKRRGILISDFGSTFGGWLSGYRWIRVIYTAGFGSTGNGAARLQEAVAYQVQHALNQAKQHGRSPVTIGGNTVTMPAAMRAIDPRAAELLGGRRLLERLIA